MDIKIEAIGENRQEGLLKLWNRCFDQPCRITEDMLRDRVFHDADLYREGSFLLSGPHGLSGFILTKVNSCGMPGYEGCAWISSLAVEPGCQGKGWGGRLYGRAEEALKKAGIKKVILGGEANNFFSGIPQPEPRKIEFFRKQGFVLNEEEHYDLMADVSAIDFEKYGALAGEEGKFSYRPCKKTDRDALDAFFAKSFPDRWRYEVMGYVDGGGDPGNVIALMDGDGVAGFCKINISDSRDNETLYGVNRGSLGPIGISEDVRGRGLGRSLLLASLKELKRRGARNVLIDWTILKDFYGQFGFTPWRTYRGAYKLL